MLDKSIFSEEYILKKKDELKCNSDLLERAIFAFGLLEALVKTGAKFIFKGGTSLMLLLEKPLRLSTDIDIIVEPGTDIIEYVEMASKIYPFLRYEEQIRNGVNNIEKRHFKFYYRSLRNEKNEIVILLDVVFEKNHYCKLIQKEINNAILKTKGDPIFVTLPSAESILGDKLTAFAPKTIGVHPLEIKRNETIINKKTETIKQFFDVASLFDIANDFNDVKESYEKTASSELSYRGLNLSVKDCLLDSFRAAVCIMSRGTIDKSDYENLYLPGIKNISAYIINTKWNGETSYIQASKIMLLSACFLVDLPVIKDVPSQEPLKGVYSKLNYIRKYNQKYFDIAAYAVRLLETHNIK